jgi:hypothetical protein
VLTKSIWAFKLILKCFYLPKNLKSENNNPWFKPWFDILLHTQTIVCATVDSQCLEYLGYIALVSFWNSWSHTDISCCYLLFLGDIWSSQFYASRPRRDFCPFREVLASRPEKWSAEQNRAEGLKSECLQICSLSWLYQTRNNRLAGS